MHKSKGNSIPLEEALEKVGADPARWLYAKANPAENMRFGYTLIEETKRKLLTLQNVYTFFAAYTCTFANAKWNCGCRDTYCVFNGWQIQAIRNPIGNPIAGGGNTGGVGGNFDGAFSLLLQPPGRRPRVDRHALHRRGHVP
jgi:hypothetical protein